MTAPVVTVGPDMASTAVRKLLERQSISAVPVVAGDGHLLGIVSTTDLVRDLASHGDTPRTAGDLMTAPVVVAQPAENLDEAAWRLVAARVHRLVVTENDRPVGILSARDMLQEMRTKRISEPIRSIMTTDVETLEVGDPIDDAVAKLAASSVHGLVVVDGTTPVGVFTQAEALAVATFPPLLRRDPVEEVMSYETICLDASTPIYRAAAQARAMNIRRILVVEKHHLVGILSCIDLVGVLARATT